METRDFDSDLEMSNNPALLKEWERISFLLFPFSKFKHKDNSREIQRELGADAIIELPKGRRYLVELKTKRQDYFNNKKYPIEIAHHIYENESKKNKLQTKEGWLYNTTADVCMFATLNKQKTKIIEVLVFGLYPLKEAYFSKQINELPPCWAKTKYKNGYFQLTLNKLADVSFFKKNTDKTKFKYWRDLEYN